jgi:hypothetical protein
VTGTYHFRAISGFDVENLIQIRVCVALSKLNGCRMVPNQQAACDNETHLGFPEFMRT